jgi:arylsulfatase
MEQRCEGTLRVRAEPFARLRLPKIYTLPPDAFEYPDVTSHNYDDWLIDRGYLVFATQKFAAEFAATFKDLPPRQKAASFTIDDAVAAMANAGAGAS